MDPARTFCPNLVCAARGQTGQGNIGIHSRKEQRFICTACRKTFTATQGTALYRLRTSAETVRLVVTLMAHGCPLQAIVVAFGFDERTVAAWWARSGKQGQAVQECLVEQPRDLGHVQADEIRVKKQGGIVWMALAMMVKTRLWLGGEVSEQRDMSLIRRLIERVRRCATHRPLLICTDGLVSSIRAVRETLRDPVHTGTGGRPRLRPWRNVLIAQVIKRYERRRVVETERRIIDGTPARVETLRRRSQGDGVLNTAYIERPAIPANGPDVLCDDDVGALCWRFDLNLALMSMPKRPHLSACRAEHAPQASSGHTSPVTNGNRRVALLPSQTDEQGLRRIREDHRVGLFKTNIERFKQLPHRIEAIIIEQRSHPLP
jgi:transposase-like protein